MAETSGDIDWLAESAAANPGAPALVDDDGNELSYAELDGLASSAATDLRDRGLTAGDIHLVAVGLVDAALVAELWGAWRSGIVPLVIEIGSPLLTGHPHRVAAWTALTAPGVHTIVLTSGSAGDPRPVRLTRSNVAAAVAASAQRIGNDADDRWLLALPVFHIGGMSILWRSAAAGGVVVIHNRFDEKRVSGEIHDGGVTIASLVPTMLYRLLEHDAGPYSGMRAVLVGGAAAQRELVERGLEAGLPILQTYGMTETCSQAATVVPGEAIESLGSVGRPLAGVRLSTGEAGVGEIVVTGPNVSPGYLGEPDRDGDYHTGDIGYVDDHGRLVVLGRIDDMVVTGGENVYPQHVAEVLGSSEFLGGVEVVAIPDPEWGQSLVAIMIGDEQALPRLQAWARQRLPRHELPKHWIYVDHMPMLPGGKVDRIALVEIARRAT